MEKATSTDSSQAETGFCQSTLKVVMTMTTGVPVRGVFEAGWDAELLRYRERAVATLEGHLPRDGRCPTCDVVAPCPAARGAELVLEL